MFYYTISAELKQDALPTHERSRKRPDKTVNVIRDKADVYNRKNPDTFFIISDMYDDFISATVISTLNTLSERQATDFFDFLGISCNSFDIDETVLEDVKEEIEVSIRNQFTEQRVSDILRRFGIEPLRHSSSYGINYDEYKTDKMTKNALNALALRSASSQSLKSELSRIYSKSAAPETSGHPVHYLIETDSKSETENVLSVLLSALYSQGRIKSRKYCVISFTPDEQYPRAYYECIYKNCTGGTVVLNLNDERAGQIFSESGLVSICCEMIKKYRHDVLTIVCLPHSCGKLKDMILHDFDNSCFVEICEDELKNEKARNYLNVLAKHHGAAADKKLYCAIVPDKTYIRDELTEIFNTWYDEKLKKSVFTQYENISNKKAVDSTQTNNAALDELNGMIGLEKAKKTIKSALNYYKIQKKYKEFGISQDKPAMHMVFTGNPGTAKTSVARVFAKIMKENGMLSSGHLVEVGRADLVGRFVGWTAQIVKQKFDEAKGGVLFIDEAYSLSSTDHGANSYGEEAINTIVQEMENKRDDLVVIFAGYPDEMNGFLDKNPGLRSRIAFHIEFPDYSTGELCAIARSIGQAKGVTMTDDAMKKLAVLFDAARNESDFGNGRYVRNVIERSKMNLASRVLGMYPDSITKEILTTIEADDIVIPEIKKAAAQNVCRIGFRC